MTDADAAETHVATFAESVVIFLRASTAGPTASMPTLSSGEPK